jgi:hypothetical protein
LSCESFDMRAVMKLHLDSVLLSFIPVVVMAYPLFIHFCWGWRRKADDVLLAMSPNCKRIYLQTFQSRKIDVKEAAAEFNKFYHSWYGRKFLLAPILIVMTVAIVLSYALADTGLFELHNFNKISILVADYVHVPAVAAAAMAGAYGFVAWDLIWRTARRNLAPADILGGAIRMLIAIPLGYSFAALLKDDLGPFIAFAAGAFPLQNVETLLQRLANKQLGVEMGASASKDQVVELSCVDRVIADRLEDADITTVCQLAYCDPVQICMRTNLSFAFVSDIAGQALAYIYLGNKLADLRPLGLRGAVELRNLCDEVKRNDPTALAVRAKAASVMDISPEVFQNVAEEIGGDPYSIFLAEMWDEPDHISSSPS